MIKSKINIIYKYEDLIQQPSVIVFHYIIILKYNLILSQVAKSYRKDQRGKLEIDFNDIWFLI